MGGWFEEVGFSGGDGVLGGVRSGFVGDGGYLRYFRELYFGVRFVVENVGCLVLSFVRRGGRYYS